MDFESLGLFGSPFEHVETYVYFDGPRTYAMRSRIIPEIYYIVNTVEEDEETGDLITLAVAVDSDRFRAIRSGVVPFRYAFTEAPSGTLSRIDWVWGADDASQQAPVPIVSPLLSREVPNRWLPTEDVRLSLPTSTVASYEPVELEALSRAQSRTIFAVEVEHDGARITEFPSRNAGELQVAMDGAVAALAKEFVGERKSSIARELRVATLDLKAASFVLVMAIDSGGTVEPTEVTGPVFEDLFRFVAAVSVDDTDAILSELRRHKSGARNRLRDLLRPLVSVRSGITLSAAFPYTENFWSVSARPESVEAAMSYIEGVKPEIGHIDVDRAILTGIVLRTKRFEIFDIAENRAFKGYMLDDAAAAANGLVVGDESYVSVRLRVETPLIHDDEEASGVKYFLESIAPFSPERSARRILDE